MLRRILNRLEGATALDPISDRMQSLVRTTLDAQSVRDLLHGTWLGHPLHPVLVHAPVGAFLSAAVLDALPGQEHAADTLIAVGAAGAIPAATAGWADWSTLSREQRRVGLVHAATNVVALTLYVGSLAARFSGRRSAGRSLAYAGLTVAGAGAYLGGHLTYEQGARVRQQTAAVPVTEAVAEPFIRP